MGTLSEKLGRRSVESFFWRILGTACLFFMHALLGQTLLPEDYGLFSFALSIVTILVLFTTMGWPKALLRLIPQYVVSKQWRLLKGALVSSQSRSILLSSAFSLVLLFISQQVEDASRSTALFYASLLLPVRSLMLLRRSMFQGLHNVKGSILPDEVLLPGIILAGLLLLSPLSISAVFVVYLAVSCGVFLFTLLWFRRLLPSEMAAAKPVYQHDTWFRLALPLLFGGLSQVVLGQCGVVLLGFMDEMESTGLFSASARIALFVTFVMTAINVIGMPMMASALHNGDSEGLGEIYRRARLWSILGALPIFVVLVTFPERVLSLFGSEFTEAASLLRVLALGQIFNAAVGLAGSLLVVGGEERYFMNSMMAVTLLCVLSMLLAIPLWGAMGAACSYSVSLGVLSLLQLYRAENIIHASNVDRKPSVYE